MSSDNSQSWLKSLIDRALDQRNKSNRRDFIILAPTLISTILLYLGVSSLFSKSSVEIHGTIFTAFLALIFSIIVTMCFSAFEKVGVLLPIQRRLSSLSDDLDEKLKAMGDQIVNEGAKAGERLEKAIKGLEDYEGSRTVRLKFGFANVAGLQIIGSATHSEPAVNRHNIFLDELNRATETTTICYMNTVLDDIDNVTRGLLDAVSRGVEIRMLVMNPKATTLVEARFEDIRRHSTYSTIESFVEFLTERAHHLRELEAQLNKHGDHGGKLTLHFFDESLNYPMIALYRRKEDVREPIVVYTGFYGSRSSEDMPYIEWREGEFHPYREFFEVFENKWAKHEESERAT
jgi:hypothetical protein